MALIDLLGIVAAILMTLGYVLLIIAGARVHLIWLFAIPLIPFALILFVIKYWQRAKTPFLIYLSGIFLLILIEAAKEAVG